MSKHLDELDDTRPITLVPYPNGGWVVEQGGSHMGHETVKHGAFSGIGQALDALADRITGT